MLSVLLAAALFMLAEAALQVRSYLRYGQSVLSQLRGESQYQRDERTGLNLLRPSRVSGGALQVVHSNSFGLRSAEIELHKPKGSIRIAVLGASTVFGAYAATNEATFPARLEAALARQLPGKAIQVINAGLPGLGLEGQRQLFEKLVAGFEPDFTVVYPGFNDFGGYCRAGAAESTWRRRPLVEVAMPPWLRSVELLLKNTVWVRTPPPGLKRMTDAAVLDLDPYRERLRRLVQTIQRQGSVVLIARNARSYRPEQPQPVQLELSSTARFYSPCFDLEGLHLLYERHNAAISNEGRALGAITLPLDEVVPGGREYFVDASHFSERGERLVADWLAHQMLPLLRSDQRGGR